MKDRCSGSGKLAVGELTRVPDRRLPGRLIALGTCPDCGAWIGVHRNGELRVHVNWPARNHERAREKRLEGGLFS